MDRYTLHRLADRVWKFLRHDIKYGVRNLVSWFPVIWADRDWDQYFLLRMMEKKLGSMADLHKIHGNTKSRNSISRQLRLASTLCKRLREDKYWDEAMKVYPQPPDYKTWFEGRKYCSTPDPNARPRLELERELAEKDKRMLGELFAKYINHWWD